MPGTATMQAPTSDARYVVQGASRTITEADVVAFSGLTRDWHPQHSDAVWAARSVFGERIAHGMLVLSYAIGLLPLHLEHVIALRRVDDVVFKRPVRLGDTITASAELKTTRPAGDDQRLVEWRLEVANERGETVLRGTLVALCGAGAVTEPPSAFEPAPRRARRFARGSRRVEDDLINSYEDRHGRPQVLL
jgi:3-hydroxybutyryl-CoA dehydratase